MYDVLSRTGILLALLLFAVPAPADSRENRAAGRAAFDAWRQDIESKDRAGAKTHADELVACGDPAVRLLEDAADEDDDTPLARESFRLLMKRFPNHERTRELVMQEGLASPNDAIRYESAFFLGEHRVFESFRRLRTRLNDAAETDWVRFASAKSLAELGEPDVITTLYDGLSHDRYMIRHLSNLGLKGLTGKNLNDFDYQYGEGAFVSFGVELAGPRDPIREATLRAERYAAIARYCTWLNDARPDVFKHLAGGFFR